MNEVTKVKVHEIKYERALINGGGVVSAVRGVTVFVRRSLTAASARVRRAGEVMG